MFQVNAYMKKLYKSWCMYVRKIHPTVPINHYLSSVNKIQKELIKKPEEKKKFLRNFFLKKKNNKRFIPSFHSFFFNLISHQMNQNQKVLFYYPMLIYAKPFLACFKHSNLFKVNELKLFTFKEVSFFFFFKFFSPFIFFPKRRKKNKTKKRTEKNKKEI